MRTYWRILRFARPFNVIIPVYSILVILHTAFRVINFTALIPILQILFNSEIDSKVPGQIPEFGLSDQYFIDLFNYYLGSIIAAEGKMGALYFICGVLLVSVFLANLFHYISTLIEASVRVRAVTNIRNDLFNNLTILDLRYFTDIRKGDVMSRLTTDVQQVEVTVINSLKVLFKEPFMIIGFFFALLRISPSLTLYTLLLLPISGGVISYIGKKLKRRAKKTQESLSRLTSILEESISGMRIIKAFNLRSYVSDKFNNEVSIYGGHNFKMEAKNSLASPLSEFIGTIFICAILILGGMMILGENAILNAAELIVFLVIFSQVLNPAKSISNAFTNIQRGIASGERIFDLLDSKPEILEDPDPVSIKDFNDRIVLRNVEFAYAEKGILHDISLEISKGKIIALVGPSGAGKSTIADLIPRFYDIKSGHLTIDKTDIQRLKINDLRKLIGYVSQEPILFNDTIYNNIAMGNTKANPAEVKRAAEIANAHEFIENLEQKYDTSIGERGLKLSGGQRQRLSIARAILKNPPILILDEATAALDSESEKLVQDALYTLMQNRTTLVIAHRLSTIQNADNIIVLDRGRIVEEGTHDNLMKKKGVYHKFIRMQSVG